MRKVEKNIYKNIKDYIKEWETKRGVQPSGISGLLSWVTHLIHKH